MILLKNKIQSLESGGSVGIASDFKVMLPKNQMYDPSVLFAKYSGKSGSSRSSKSSTGKTTVAKPKSLTYDLKGATDGGQSTLNAFLKNSINQLSGLDPSSANYNHAYDLMQLQIKDVQTSLAKDGADYTAARKDMETNGSSSMMAMEGNAIYVYDKALKDVKRMNLNDWMKPENKKKYPHPLTVSDLAEYKNTATNGNNTSLFLDRGIRTNNVIRHNLGEAKLITSIDKVFKGIGNISSKDGVIEIEGSQIGNALLEEVLQTGKIPAVASTNAPQLAQALDVARDRISSDATLRDSFQSMAITNLRNKGQFMESVSTEEEQEQLYESIDKEQNRILVNMMAKNLKIKLGGGTGGSSVGAGITGVGSIGQRMIALDKNLNNGRAISLGSLTHDPEKYSTEFSGAAIYGSNFNMTDEILDEYNKDNEGKPVSVAKLQELRKYVEGTTMYSPTGGKLPYRAASQSVINTEEDVQYLPQVFTFDGVPDLKRSAAINTVFESDETAAQFREVMRQINPTTGPQIARVVKDFVTKKLAMMGEEDRIVRSKPMLLVPIITSNDMTMDGDQSFSDMFEDNPYMTEDDSFDQMASDGGVPDSATNWWTQTYRGYTLMDAKSAAAIQTESGDSVYVPKAQLGTAAFKKVEKEMRKGVQLTSLLSDKVYANFIKR